MDGVLSRREIVQVELERDSRSLIPDNNTANIFPLGIFQFDLGLRGAQGRQSKKYGEHSAGETEMGLHGAPPGKTNGIIANREALGFQSPACAVNERRYATTASASAWLILNCGIGDFR